MMTWSFIDIQPQVEGKEVIWGVIDDEDTLINRIAQVMSATFRRPCAVLIQ